MYNVITNEFASVRGGTGGDLCAIYTESIKLVVDQIALNGLSAASLGLRSDREYGSLS